MPSHKRKRLDTDDASATGDTGAISASSNAGATEPTPEAIDPDGDLFLVIGAEIHGKPHTFRVCSAAMRRACQPWRSMLFGPWREAKPAHGDWVVQLPEDDPDAMRILLLIVHGTVAEVPEGPSLDELEDLVQVADKYDLLHILRPWTMCCWEGRVLDIDYEAGEDLITCIHVAWQLRAGDAFAEKIKELALGLGYTETGFTYGGVEFTIDPSACGPPDIAGKLLLTGMDVYTTSALTYSW
jgi:hypothetical protein